MFPHAVGEDRAQLLAVFDPVAVRGESRVGGQRGQADGLANCGHCRSDSTATAISPSAVRRSRTGTMLGCALPCRPGAVPRNEGVLRLVDERCQGRAEQRDIDTLACGARAGALPSDEPASTLTAPSIPDTTSLIATPTFVGSPPSASAAPVIDMRPLAAWITKS